MKKRSIRAIAIIAAFCVAFTSLPMMMGDLESSAMAKKKKAKVAKNVTVSAYASGQTKAVIKWNRIKKPDKGYAVFRNGILVAHLGKRYSFNDSGLRPGTAYKYQIKTYKTKKARVWYNKKTGKWQKKRPKKKWRGKSQKITTYTYKKKSNVVTIRTAPKPAAPTPAPLNKYTITWKNYNGVILQSTTVLQGNTPSYSGATPTRPADDYIYTFKGWSPAVTAATSNRTYVAQYSAKENLLPAPTGVAYKMKSNTSVKITWNAVTGAEKYAVLRNGQVAYVTTNFVTDSTLTAGNEYTFQIAAVKNGKIQTRSQEFTVTAKTGESGTVEDPTTPTTPTTPTATTKQVTDYLGVTRTITKEDYGWVYWYTNSSGQKQGTMIDPMARYDKTVDGEFTVSGGTVMKQVGGATFVKQELENPSAKNYAYAIKMYNGDSSKLTFELSSGVTIGSISTYNWFYKDSLTGSPEPMTAYYFMKNGHPIAQTCWKSPEFVKESKSGNVTTKTVEVYTQPDIGSGIGVYADTFSITIKYNGSAIGKINVDTAKSTVEGCTSSVNGMSPYRRLALDIANAAIAEKGDTGTFTQNMYLIEDYIDEHYEYGETVSGYGTSMRMNCIGGANVLETYAIYYYGKWGFAGPGSNNNGDHIAFHLNSDPTIYFESDGSR